MRHQRLLLPDGGSELQWRSSPLGTGAPGLESPPAPWLWSSAGDHAGPDLQSPKWSQQQQQSTAGNFKRRGMKYRTRRRGGRSSSPSSPPAPPGLRRRSDAERRRARPRWRRARRPGTRPGAPPNCSRCAEETQRKRNEDQAHRLPSIPQRWFVTHLLMFSWRTCRGSCRALVAERRPV